MAKIVECRPWRCVFLHLKSVLFILSGIAWATGSLSIECFELFIYCGQYSPCLLFLWTWHKPEFSCREENNIWAIAPDQIGLWAHVWGILLLIGVGGASALQVGSSLCRWAWVVQERQLSKSGIWGRKQSPGVLGGVCFKLLPRAPASAFLG